MEPLQWESVTSSFTAGVIVSRAPARRWKSFFSAYTISPQSTFTTAKNHIPIPTCGAAPSAYTPEDTGEHLGAPQHPTLAAGLSGMLHGMVIDCWVGGLGEGDVAGVLPVLWLSQQCKGVPLILPHLQPPALQMDLLHTKTAIWSNPEEGWEFS